MQSVKVRRNQSSNLCFIFPHQGKSSVSSGYIEPSSSGNNSGATTPKAEKKPTTSTKGARSTSKGDKGIHGDPVHSQAGSTEATSAIQQAEVASHGGERSFGTNLTTGEREYLSQYDHLRDQRPSPGTPIERWETDMGDAASVNTALSDATGRTIDSDLSGGNQSSDIEIY